MDLTYVVGVPILLVILVLLSNLPSKREILYFILMLWFFMWTIGMYLSYQGCIRFMGEGMPTTAHLIAHRSEVVCDGDSGCYTNYYETYAYTVNAVTHFGEYRVGSLDDFVLNHSIEIVYDPQRPAYSVLRSENTYSRCIKDLVGAVLFLVLAGFLIVWTQLKWRVKEIST